MAKLSDIFQKATSLLTNYIEEGAPVASTTLGNFGHHGNLLMMGIRQGVGVQTNHDHQHQHKSKTSSASDGEIIFSKNNICIHSQVPSNGSHTAGIISGTTGAPQHLPGYFTIKVHKFLPFSEDGDDHEESTLILNWVPNTVIEQHPKSITPDSSPVKTITRKSSEVPPEEIASDLRTLNMSKSGSTNFPGQESNEESLEAVTDVCSNDFTRTVCSSSSKMSSTDSSQTESNANHYQNNLNPFLSSSSSTNPFINCSANNNNFSLPKKGSVPGSVISLTSGRGRAKVIGNEPMKHVVPQTAPIQPPQPIGEPLECPQPFCSQQGIEDGSSRPSSLPLPLAEPITLDLRQMKSLRLFFSSTEETPSAGQKEELLNGSCSPNSTGQLVIAARDGRFQVFHFHRGGLDRLVSVLEEWQFLKKRQKHRSGGMRPRSESTTSTSSVVSNLSTPPPGSVSTSSIRQFSVWRPPTLKQDECHIEEGIYSELDEESFHRRTMNSSGQIEDPFKFRRIVFFGGVDAAIRREVWPFLLKRFKYDSTFSQRKLIVETDREKYEDLDRRRMAMSPEEADLFWKRVQSTVEKDCPRTDRTNPFFAGETNQNVLIMKRILLNYAFHNPSIGYTQGMSDLLAPLLIEMRDESEAFWSFEGLMERTFFISSPKDSDMDANLSLLRELLRMMNPRFFNHLASMPDGLELLFTHRWLLLCFKREFPESAALKIWEAAWSRYQTDYFHLFVCLSVIAIYGNEVMDQDMKADEILFHFSTMTLHMNGDLVLKKARGLLYHFKNLEKIPCSLKKLLMAPCEDNVSGDMDIPPPSPASASYMMMPLPAIECVRRFRNSSGSSSTFIPMDACQCSLSLANETEANLHV